MDRENADLKKKISTLELDLNSARQRVNSDKLQQARQESFVSKQRLDVESEMQKIKEEKMSLESRLANTKYELEQKEVRSFFRFLRPPFELALFGINFMVPSPKGEASFFQKRFTLVGFVGDDQGTLK